MIPSISLQSPVSAFEAPACARFTIHEVPSDYMAPTLQPGDLVEIDSAVTRAHDDGIYLVALPAGNSVLRRIQVLLDDDQVRVFCDRDPFEYEECHNKDIRILGRATRAMNVRQL